MIKVFMPAPNEDWVCDNIIKEFKSHTKHIIVESIKDADVIWMYAKWIANHFDTQLLIKKPCITTIHHVVPGKSTGIEELNKFTNIFHCPNKKTESDISKLTNKQIHVIPYWVSTSITSDLHLDEEFIQTNKEKFDCKRLFASFQRDTEGNSIASGKPTPKLEKGPDILVDILDNFDDSKLFLGGWRRQYIKSKIHKNKLIDMTASSDYSPALASMHDVNVVYHILKHFSGTYLVTSRHEGGPQAILEAAKVGCRILSTDVGIAKQVLHSNCIIGKFDDINMESNKKIVSEFKRRIEQLNDDDWNEIQLFNSKNIENFSIKKLIDDYDKLIEVAYVQK